MIQKEQVFKYGCLAIVAQLLACALIWLTTIILPPGFNPLFELMIKVYMPVINALAAFVKTGGESAMLAIPIYGMALGMIVYGVAIGFLISYLKGRRSHLGEGKLSE